MSLVSWAGKFEQAQMCLFLPSLLEKKKVYSPSVLQMTSLQTHFTAPSHKIQAVIIYSVTLDETNRYNFEGLS